MGLLHAQFDQRSNKAVHQMFKRIDVENSEHRCFSTIYVGKV